MKRHVASLKILTRSERTLPTQAGVLHWASLAAVLMVTVYCVSGRASAQILIQSAKLLASDGAAGDSFGYSVSVSNDVIVVGARRDDDNGIESGSVYVFRCDGSSWKQEQKLLATDGEADDVFGNSVSVSGDRIRTDDVQLGKTLFGLDRISF